MLRGNIVCDDHERDTLPRYEGELVVEYDSGEKTYVSLSASAGGVDVYLSTPSLQIDPAYIGLSRWISALLWGGGGESSPHGR